MPLTTMISFERPDASPATIIAEVRGPLSETLCRRSRCDLVCWTADFRTPRTLAGMVTDPAVLERDHVRGASQVLDGSLALKFRIYRAPARKPSRSRAKRSKADYHGLRRLPRSDALRENAMCGSTRDITAARSRSRGRMAATPWRDLDREIIWRSIENSSDCSRSHYTRTHADLQLVLSDLAAPQVQSRSGTIWALPTGAIAVSGTSLDCGRPQ